MADTMSIDKHDIKNDSDESLDSGPENEPTSAGGSHDNVNSNAQDSQPAKRKGGRKPVRVLLSVPWTPVDTGFPE